MRKAWLGAAAALVLAACSDNSSPPPPSSPGVNGWTMSFSQGTALQASPGALWQFAFPAYPGHVNMVTTTAGGLKGAQLSAVVEVGEANPAWIWKFEDSNTCNPGSLPQVHLYFQRAGDDFSGAGEKEFYRWWSGGVEIRPAAQQTITIGLNPEVWTSVYGKPGTANPPSFAAAIANAANVGMVFGGGCFAGHGVAVTSGAATFKLKSFQ